MQWLILILVIPYFYLLLKIYGGLLKIRSYQPNTTSEVFVSVIVACRNEEKNLPSLLSDIAAQTYNPDLLELIIVNDNSTDSTYEIASGFRAIKNLKILRNAGNGKKNAIKTGVEACNSELIVTTDADCRVGNNWIKTITSFYAESKPEMIICPVELQGGRGFFHRFQELEFLSLQGVTAGTAITEKPVMCNGANLAFTKQAYNLHSGDLHEEKVSGDDVFLLHSIKENKENRILWLESADVLATTKTSETVSSFIHQRARWISKAGSYSDGYTVALAIVTFVTILLQTSLFVVGIFNPVFLLVFLAAFILKSIPDFLILQNTAMRYKKKNLLWFFLPGQFIYPFYVISVLVYFLLTKINYSKSHLNF